jgi:hypothetical protein
MVQTSKAGRWLPHVSLLWLALCCTVLDAQTGPAGLQQVALGWNASPDPTVVGYYFYYGAASGVYTNKADVGTNTAFTASGLVPGTTYYFSSTSYNAARVESGFVPEVSYVVPGILTVAVTENQGNAITRIQFPVAPTHSYQLESSPDLKNWSNLWLTTTQTTNGWLEYDEASSNLIPSRFYRLILH